MTAKERQKVTEIIQLFRPDLMIADTPNDDVDSALDYLRICVMDLLLDNESLKREAKQIH